MNTLIIQFLITFSFSLLFIFLLNKKKYLSHYAGENHQNYIKTNPTPLAGGFIVFFYFLLNIENISLVYIFFFLILLIGYLSDTNIIKSAHFRLVIQITIIILFVFFYDLRIISTRILILDELLNDYFFAILFTSFCILILVNGTNFIDGTNLLAIGYFIILEIIFLYLRSEGLLINENIFSLNLFPALIVILLLNFSNKIYLGDAGAYLLGFIYSTKCILLYLENQNISPFFVILILWYPAFEILFSILRKLNFNKSPIKPDSNHLHQLIYLSLHTTVSDNILRSNFVGLIINFYNSIIFFFALSNIYNTQYQIILIFLNIIIYIFIYIRLIRLKLRKQF